MNIYYKRNNLIYTFTEGQFVPADMVLLTPQEVKEYLATFPTEEEILATQIRAERDSKIQEIRWRLERARDEQDLGLPLTEPIEPILLYIQELRDVPEQEGFPWDVEWPEGV